MEISINKFSSYEFRFIVSPNLTPGHFILFVSDPRRSLAFYDRASDIDGNELPTTQHDKRIGNGGQVTEEVYITFPRDYLEQHRQSGLHFKLFGKRDQLEIRVHAFYLDGFLQKVDEYLAKKDEGK